jgi:hypothetical protein
MSTVRMQKKQVPGMLFIGQVLKMLDPYLLGEVRRWVI